MTAADFVRYDALEAATEEELEEIISDGGPTALIDAARDELGRRENGRRNRENERRSPYPLDYYANPDGNHA